jgi:hypothetical protein
MISLSSRICGCYLQIDTPEAVIRNGVDFYMGDYVKTVKEQKFHNCATNVPITNKNETVND